MSLVEIIENTGEFTNSNNDTNINPEVVATVVKSVDKTSVDYQTDFIYTINVSFSGISGQINSATITDFIPDYIDLTLPTVSGGLVGIYETPVEGGTLITFDFGALKDLGSAYVIVFGCRFKVGTPVGTQFTNKIDVNINGSIDTSTSSQTVTLNETPKNVTVEPNEYVTEDIVDASIYKLNKFKQLLLQSELCIHSQKPDIGNILGQNVSVDITESYVIKTPVGTSYEGHILTGYKLMVYGEVKVAMDYVSCECPSKCSNKCSSEYNLDRLINYKIWENSLTYSSCQDTTHKMIKKKKNNECQREINESYKQEFTIPFSTFISIPENEQNYEFDIQAIVEDTHQQIIDCRSIFTTVTLLLVANNL